MSELDAQDHLFDTPAPERTFEYQPLESRRTRRARLEGAEVAKELGDASPPFGAPVMSAEIFGEVFTHSSDAAGTERGLF